MSGVEHLEFDKLDSKYILVCDADKLGQLQISGASYTNAKIVVRALKGGHSGIDIGDETRLNAAKLIAELLAKFPQGAYYKDETGVITSCNLGALVAGGVQNSVASIVEKGIKTNNYIEEIMKKTSTNIINTLGMASYSIRSASVAKENELKDLMVSIVEEFNKKYEGLAKAEIEFEVHLLPFEQADDDRIQKVHTQACINAGVKNEISSFHAGAETHIYCHNKNSKGETFLPSLLGLANIYNMHSAEEKVDYKSGYNVRIDSAVRQNVLTGIRQVNLEVQKQVGRDFGADGGVQHDSSQNGRQTQSFKGQEIRRAKHEKYQTYPVFYAPVSAFALPCVLRRRRRGGAN